ncbi:D-alanyl-lipoteichoic acid biosynthesis protein DltB [Bacillus sp. 7586-K]|uniref:Teichoic acid D-alanyltransferase n=1 Tax=Metabacillus niabensis TaxID=324854 RepID=A0ABT9Z7Y6_9BACI|nr:D-alanyl-lipoteichoic acid biosynthesis protein DltB [Metabacillus niabensis]MDQ0228120.1 membrane protein involved in D-alanine export [Metabacillus niabensis]PAD67756.1 D-alanyl-lipoteichoic acid biosynthesis protein DltB [Bacillus sp. 7586-K]
MTPYSSFLFFIILGILLLPTMILGTMGKRLRYYNVFVSIVVLAIIFSEGNAGFFSLVAFTILQVVLVKGYITYRQTKNSSLVFYVISFLSILPLILSKVLPILAVDNWASFLGISYLTFRAVQIIIETRDGLIKEQLSIFQLVNFMLFYPTISSGPIDRFRRFQKDEEKCWTPEEYKELLYKGINKIFIGFLYKFIIGYSINTYFIMNLDYIADGKFSYHLLYMYSYSLYLFFDFAGYTAFAVGVSYIMGIRSPENFNKPFISRNIKDFWNRWHMSLSFWFRDYVFMRFVFLMKKKKWIQNKMLVSNLGYALLFLLMGIWHGVAIQYIIYGAYHALMMVGFNFFETWNKKHKRWPTGRVMTFVSIVITFHVVCFGFYLFSGKPFQ